MEKLTLIRESIAFKLWKLKTFKILWNVNQEIEILEPKNLIYNELAILSDYEYMFGKQFTGYLIELKSRIKYFRNGNCEFDLVHYKNEILILLPKTSVIFCLEEVIDLGLQIAKDGISYRMILTEKGIKEIPFCLEIIDSKIEHELFSVNSDGIEYKFQFLHLKES